MIRFITGTGDDCGKTVVSSALAIEQQKAQRRVSYFKPIQTGREVGDRGDVDFVSSTARIECTEGVRFSGKLDPAIAAEQAGAAVGVDWLVGMARAQASTVDMLLVEGTGGLLSPIGEELTMVDLARHMGADVVLVTGLALGTLNQTALTVEALRSRHVDLVGLIISKWPSHPGVIERTTLERLRRLAPIIAVCPFVRGLDTAGATPDSIEFELQPAPFGAF